MGLFDRYPCVKQVIVNTKSEKAFRGVLWKRTGEYLVLRNVQLLKPRGDVTDVDGEVMILAANVDFIQVVG